MKKDTRSPGNCIHGLDFIDKLLIILFAIVVLLVNIGIFSTAWLAYWPLFLIVWIIKEFLDE
ncbi:hypothetical protein DRH29_01060 [candidate division Kazan bacterium]|uniref:DUF5668 domain-containing protein n=1 Tax=candidate division Kazan bacterium TaxID=2202143 RepID=A0A420ZDQ1_UNCK3|nr:MAG: hypothetical protein DRH29_01060 [candidate division Kazan bacterium]